MDKRRLTAVGLLIGAAVGGGLWLGLGAPSRTGTFRPAGAEQFLEEAPAPTAVVVWRERETVSSEGADIVAGRVIDGAEAPVAGARVYQSGLRSILVQRDKSFLTTSDSGGRFRFPIDRFVADVVMVAAAGFPTVQIPKSEISAQRGRDFTVRLPTGRTVEGEVVDVWGSPIAGATVESLGRYGIEIATAEAALAGARAGSDYVSVRTDALGRFRAAGVSALPVMLRGRAVNYVDYHRGDMVVVRDAAEHARLTMFPLARLGLRVIDVESGAGIPADIAITFRSGLSLTDYDIGARPSTSARTGWNGDAHEQWFTFRASSSTPRDLAPERIGGEVSSPGFASEKIDFAPRWGWDEHADEPYVVALRRSIPADELGRIEVSVRAPVAEKAFRRGQLILDQKQKDRPGATWRVPLWLGVDGTMAFSVPAGTYDLTLSGAGWAWWRGQVRQPNVAVRAGGGARVTFDVRVGELNLEVREADGTPLHHHFVTVLPVRMQPLPTGSQRIPYGTLDSEQFFLSDAYEFYRSAVNVHTPRSTMLLLPGEYDVMAWRPGLEIVTKRFTITDGIVQAAEITLGAEAGR